MIDGGERARRASDHLRLLYPQGLQWVIQAMPLWHGVDMIRQLTTGLIQPSIWLHLLYFAVMIVVGLWFTTVRLRALFLR